MIFAAIAVVAIVVIAAIVLLLRMPGRSFRGPAPPHRNAALSDALRRDVTTLARDIGPRNLDAFDAYARAAEFIERSFRDAGYAPRRDEASNIEAVLPGTSDEIVVVGAHYDTVDDSPGADDNGSGVAALLALARMFAGTHPHRTIRFVAFANEEPPYFQSEPMGSFVYARARRARKEKIVAMLSLESIGWFSDAPRSQQYPALLEALYPSTANFIAFASNVASRPLLQRVIATFRAHATIPSEGGALPEEVPGVAWSDQWAFWHNGYQAVMVTDTALFRNPTYHTASDTPETLDYERLARVVEGLHAVIDDLLSP
jgi:Zn-dependent M28 family amino/carboxypeptidase